MDNLIKKGLRLEYFTVIYNILEAIASILFGYLAGSIALVGFGLDSIVESLSGFVLIWRLGKYKIISKEEEEKIEKKAIKFVAITFFILGLYISIESIKKLYLKEIPDTSLPGIIISIVSLIIMPILAYKKFKVGKEIGSRALVADSKETMACTFLSFTLFFGLGANYLFGFWQADPITGLIIVLFLFKEGYELLFEKSNEESCEEKINKGES